MRRILAALVAAYAVAGCGPAPTANETSDATPSPPQAEATPPALAAPAAPAQWYIANEDFTSCHEGESPADKIKSIRDNGEEAATSDTNGSDGALESVEVSTSSSSGLSTISWTFYRTREACEAAAQAHNSIPNRYQ